MAHVPQRMCAVCRTRNNPSEFFRVAADKKNGRIVSDPHKNIFGRGAYICKNIKCIKAAEKKNVLQRHIGLEACEDLYRQLEDMI